MNATKLNLKLMNYYQRMMKFINRKYNGDYKDIVIRYFNSDAFEIDLNNFIRKQAFAGEPVSKMFAAECVLESFIQDCEDEDNTIIIQ